MRFVLEMDCDNEDFMAGDGTPDAHIIRSERIAILLRGVADKIEARPLRVGEAASGLDNPTVRFRIIAIYDGNGNRVGNATLEV